MFLGYYLQNLIWMLPVIILAGLAQAAVSKNYATYSRIANSKNLTGAEVAQSILRENGVNDIRVEATNGRLTDHYDPRGKVIRLSQGVYESNSIAAISIAAHECGHAIQYNQGYLPIKVRNALVPVASLANTLVWGLIFVGFIFQMLYLIDLAIVLYLAIFLFQVVTLPVEFNASKRALNILAANYVSSSELKGAKKMLNSAALTYVAAMLASLLQLIRLLVIRNSRD
ncbi:MAG: zinc metallopeptidase [Clostridia bacterium]